MAIDRNAVVGAALVDAPGGWDADDVILYHLGLGAGAPPTDPGELAYVYEDGLKILPSFAVIPALAPMWRVFSLPGMDIDLRMILHGEQVVEVHAALPTAATVVTSGTVTDVFDKGKGALIVVELVTRDAHTGAALFTNRNSIFVRGEGGFGGPSGPAAGAVAPERAPDQVVRCPTLPQQALLYRLSGDKHKLHADPGYAAAAGFDQPILHGLCSYGIACKAAVDAALDGDVGRVAGYRARFAAPVYPGETIEVSLWEDGATIWLQARCVERDVVVLSHAALETRGG
jgi:acyl dehydratase